MNQSIPNFYTRAPLGDGTLEPTTMIRFRVGNEDTARGIGLNRKELMALLHGHPVVVEECPLSGIPGMVIFSGITDTDMRKRVDDTLGEGGPEQSLHASLLAVCAPEPVGG